MKRGEIPSKCYLVVCGTEPFETGANRWSIRFHISAFTGFSLRAGISKRHPTPFYYEYSGILTGAPAGELWRTLHSDDHIFARRALREEHVVAHFELDLATRLLTIRALNCTYPPFDLSHIDDLDQYTPAVYLAPGEQVELAILSEDE